MPIEPSATLVEPPAEPDHIMETVGNVLGFAERLSLSYWAGEAAKQICGCNPWEWVAQQFAGDWHLVMRASIAVGNLATFNTAFAETIKSKADPLFAESWSGDRATEADQYFDKLVERLGNQVEPLRQTSKAFSDAAAGVLSAASNIKGYLETLTDLLIALGIELAAAALSSWTVIGGVAAGAVAAITAARAYQIWKLIVSTFDLAWTIVEGCIGLLLGYLAPLRALEVQPIPESSYRGTGSSFETVRR
jgi:hypothetical protein